MMMLTKRLGKLRQLLKVSIANKHAFHNNIHKDWRMIMMLEPSIDSLQKEIKSKYTLVTLSARRARDLREADNSQIENSISNTYIGSALEEIQAGKLPLVEDSGIESSQLAGI